jgi:hypothetical protein
MPRSLADGRTRGAQLDGYLESRFPTVDAVAQLIITRFRPE